MRIVFILLTAAFFFLSFNMADLTQDYRPSRGEQLVNSTLSKSAGIIKKNYGLNPCGEGVAMPGGPIRELTLCFETRNRYAKEQLRVLLIKSAEELLNQITENEEIQPYLNTRPFTIKNIQIIIYNHDKEGRIIYDPEIHTAEISEGKLVFETVEKFEDIFRYKNEFEESYEEALKAMKVD